MIIALAGYKQSGKTTLADEIEQYALLNGVWVKRLSYAEPIKDMLDVGLGLPYKEYKDKKEEPIEIYGMSYRDLCLSLGTGWGRDMVNDSIWSIIMNMRADYYLQDFDLIIVDDLRFLNEYERLDARGDTIFIRVWNPKVKQDPSHPTETGVDDIPEWHLEVHNNGTIEDVAKAAQAIFHRFVRPFDSSKNIIL